MTETIKSTFPVKIEGLVGEVDRNIFDLSLKLATLGNRVVMKAINAEGDDLKLQLRVSDEAPDEMVSFTFLNGGVSALIDSDEALRLSSTDEGIEL